jgi:RND family efflux transporter MFP subunit
LHAERENDLLAKQLTTVHEAHMASSQAVKTAASLAAAEARLRAMGVSIPTGGDVVQGAGTMTILSPIDGVVVRRDAVLGQFLEPSEIGFVVADPTELWATIQVFESDIPYFQVGVDVLVTVDAMPGREFPSKIALMETDVARATRALRARIPIGNKNGELRPGLFVRASVRIPSDDGESRIRVPSAAVQPLGEEDVVFIERGAGVFEVRPVRVGRRTTQVVEIVEGVSRSERLAVEGTFLLRGEITKQ